MAELWERQEGETNKAYAAFCVYRDLGPDRSLDKALVKANKKPSNRRHWSRWMAKYYWVERCEAYDLYLDELKRNAQEKERVEMAERHAKMAMMLQQKLIQRMQSLKPEDLTPNDVARWVDVAVKIERISRGEPTEIGKQDIQGQVGVTNDIAKQVISDPQASAIAHKLLERIAQNDTSGAGIPCERGAMDTR